MGSAAFIHLEHGECVERETFDQWCAEAGIVFSPDTVGGDTYYAGEVEVTFGKVRDERQTLTISTFFMGSAMPQVAAIAYAAWLRFGGDLSASPEVRRMFARTIGPRTPPSNS